MCKYDNVQMCKCFNSIFKTKYSLRTMLGVAPKKFAHLHICTFAH